MRLAAQWQELLDGLPPHWRDVGIRVRLEETGQIARAAALLGPLQPVVSADGTLAFRVGRAGHGPQPEMVRGLLERVDGERLHGTIELVAAPETGVAATPPSPGRGAGPKLAEGWDRALATLPADWSDLLAEVELDSSDYLERGALHLAPVNPRRDGSRLAFQFRCAREFGYGASPEMVRRSLERCDGEGIRGRVHVLRALSDTRPAQTQGPVWQLSGRTV
jgi:hypothetical protein